MQRALGGAWLGTAALVLAGTACGAHGASSDGFGNKDAAAPVADGSRSSDAPFQDSAPAFGDASGGGSPGDAAVFGQSSDTLYMVDPVTKAVTVVGKFTGCAFVTDIALDRNSSMYATTLDGLYTVDRTTAQCTKVASGTYPNSLSFVPIGTLDPNAEALVGYNQPDTYVRIDTTTGAVTPVGSIGQGYTSSGDIVSIKGGSTYLTVKGGPENCNDCLIEVDPATGAFLRPWGPLEYTDVFGIAFWAGAVYGFDVAGQLFEVSFNGAAIQVTRLPIPNAPPTLSFQGAGSTTIAPVTS